GVISIETPPTISTCSYSHTHTHTYTSTHAHTYAHTHNFLTFLSNYSTLGSSLRSQSVANLWVTLYLGHRLNIGLWDGGGGPFSACHRSYFTSRLPAPITQHCSLCGAVTCYTS